MRFAVSDAAPRPSTGAMERGLALLAAFEDGDAPERSVAELAQAVDLPISTAYRYVRALRQYGYLEPGKRPSTVRLGLRVLALARQVMASRPLADVARPVMHELSRITGETVLLVEPLGTRAICTERVESAEPVRLAFEKGRILPMHAGATVRALLAFLPTEALFAVVAEGLERYTDATLTDPAELAACLAQVREMGYASSEGEMDPGVRAIAMPIRAGRAYAKASLSVTGPSFRFTAHKVGPALAALRAAVLELDRALPSLP